MTRALALTLSLSATACLGQDPLGEDLDRAARRYAPAATAAPPSVEKLTAEAAEHLRADRVDKALAALDRAAALAYRSGATGRAFELSLTAAEAERSAGRAVEAAERFRAAALSNASDPRAVAAHQTACEALAATDALGRYDAFLAEHVAQWPRSDFAETARWRRVELLAESGNWQALRERVRGVEPDSPHHERSRQLLVEAHRGLAASGAGDFAAASDDLEPLILGDPPRWPAEWTRAQRDAALVLARGALGRGDAGAEYAAKLLRVATTGWPTPRDAWRRRAASLLVVASLVTGDARQADRWLSELHRVRPQERQQLLNATQRRIRESPTPAEAADGLLRSVEALSGEADAAPEAEAEALAAVGRGAEALAAYARLAADRPDDRAVQVAYANLLIESDRPADREEAVRRWRTIESRSPANADAWFEARLGRLRSLIAAGQVDDAKKLLALTRLLAPSLGGPERAAEFDAVATRLGE